MVPGIQKMQTLIFYTQALLRDNTMLKGEKGQITVEAVLILGFFILIFVGVTVPMVFNARDSAIDTTVLADAKFATEEIAAATNQVVVNGSKRTIEIYVPGNNGSSTKIGTRICTDGLNINTTVGILRDGVGESHDISAKLYSSGWSLTSPSTSYILETSGKRYTIEIEYKSIESTTSNSLNPGGFDCLTPDITTVFP
jgi:uncharacterized protein (UPF0333 family)